MLTISDSIAIYCNVQFNASNAIVQSPRVTGIKVYPQEAIDQREVIVDVDLA